MRENEGPGAEKEWVERGGTGLGKRGRNTPRSVRTAAKDGGETFGKSPFKASGLL